MRKILIGIMFMFLVVMIGCQKEELQPSAKADPVRYADWHLVVSGNDTTQFRVNFYSSVPPYILVSYTARCNVSPINIHMIVGATYGVQYRDVDDSVKVIYYSPKDELPVFDTIPALIL